MRFSLGIGLFLALTLSTAALANSTVTLQDRQQAACYDDVQNLCGAFIPDVDKTSACMAQKREQVSARCAKFYTKPAG